MVCYELSNVFFKCHTLTICVCSFFQQTLFEHFICSTRCGRDERHCPTPQRAHSLGNMDQGIGLRQTWSAVVRGEPCGQLKTQKAHPAQGEEMRVTAWLEKSFQKRQCLRWVIQGGGWGSRSTAEQLWKQGRTESIVAEHGREGTNDRRLTLSAEPELLAREQWRATKNSYRGLQKKSFVFDFFFHFPILFLFPSLLLVFHPPPSLFLLISMILENSPSLAYT